MTTTVQLDPAYSVVISLDKETRTVTVTTYHFEAAVQTERHTMRTPVGAYRQYDECVVAAEIEAENRQIQRVDDFGPEDIHATV